MKVTIFARALLAGLVLCCAAHAEDGYELWLRYHPMEQAALTEYRPLASELVVGASSPTLDAAQKELERGLGGLLDRPLTVGASITDGAVVIGTPASSKIVAGLNLPLEAAGDEGYLIRSVSISGHKATVIAANSDIGVLYGAFAYLRLIQTSQPVTALNILSAPKTRIRVLDHWDNLNGTVERGYAGASLWNWKTLPQYKSPRYIDYARANASIGINGAVLNNVNASADSLTAPYIQKAAALADDFRPYGVRVYLSVRFSAPIEIGGLKTADPLDPGVRAWWKAKADEIYKAIPDFGGFLVKANSEGQPGPQDYHRSHADGANAIADALVPHHGVVMWRAFVYSNDPKSDRAAQAYKEFTPLDGKFADNVVLQVKNGPLDFQPREPFSPLLGAMPRTALMLELQVTKEYLGQRTSMTYLGPLYEEALRSDTYSHGPGSTVAKIIDGSLDRHVLSGMAGVANIGNDRNWCGSIFNQANWYVFGRMAWDPEISAKTVAGEWVRQTFNNKPDFVAAVTGMMMASRETTVDYMTPLGLNLIMAPGSHYGPGPWDVSEKRLDWRAPYYHHADAQGLGFDRTATGSNAVAQYNSPLREEFSDLKTIPEDDLLWFHHVSWDHKMASGRTLWDELVHDYRQGVDNVADAEKTWASLQGDVDPHRFAMTAAFLKIEAHEAAWWRDGCLAYFQTFSHRPFPDGYAPQYPLKYYETLPNGVSPPE